MAGYSSDEIQGVVDSLVRADIRRPYDGLGVRRTEVTFSDIQESAAGVFLLYRKAPFYVAFLSKQKLAQDAQAIQGTILSLLENLRVLRRRTIPVKDLSSLVNAKAALFDLEGAASGTKPPKDLSKVPAFARFSANVDRFLKNVGQNIKDATGIVPTPQEARKSLPFQIEALQSQVEELVRRTGLTRDALLDYNNVGLPQIVAKSVIQKARALLDARVDELTASSEKDRLEKVRETVLELLGMKAVIKTFGSFQTPSSLTALQGTGKPFSDATRPANEAFLVSYKPGPYALVTGTSDATSSNILQAYLDGTPSYPSAPTEIDFLPPSYFARIEGQQSGPFTISAGINDSLNFSINGGPDVVVALTAGSRSAAQVSADLTTGLTTSGFQGEAYFSPLMFDGEVQVIAANQFKLSFGSFPSNSVNIGDEVDFYFGVNAGTTRTVTAVSPSTSNPGVITVDGAALTVGTSRVRYGSANRKVRVVPLDRAAAVFSRVSLQLKLPTSVETQAATTLGMFGEIISRSSPVDAQTIADYLTANSSKVRAEVQATEIVQSFAIRSEPGNGFTAVLYSDRANASYGAGTSVVLTLDQAVSSFANAGDKVVLRTGPDTGKVGTITATSAMTLSVTFGSPVSAASGVLVEVGPTGFTPGMVVVVSSGLNSGRYFIDSVDSIIPFQFKLRSVFPVSRGDAGAPVFMTCDVVLEGVRFFSRTKSLLSQMEIYDPTFTFFLTAGPYSQTGATKYFQLPSLPKDLAEGDVLEFYVTGYGTPDFTRDITKIDGDGVLTLDDTIDSTQSYDFGPLATLPFVLLRSTHVGDFDSFSARLATWLKHKDLDTTFYFRDLNRFINPLLANQNPTDSDIGSAENRVRDLLRLFTDESTGLVPILSAFTLQPEPEVDALMKAFKEKGADRAVDLLLECQFTAFFGLSQEETSYAGTLQTKVRDIARLDMPVRRINREVNNQSQLIGSAESPDYEYENQDLDTAPDIDPPVNLD